MIREDFEQIADESSLNGNLESRDRRGAKRGGAAGVRILNLCAGRVPRWKRALRAYNAVKKRPRTSRYGG